MKGRTTVLHAVMTILIAVSCARQPSAPLTSVPAPGSSSTAPAGASSAGASTSPAGAMGTAGSAATAPTAMRPARVEPRDFTAVADLRDIHFDFDRYDVRPGDAEILDGNARWLKAHEDHLVLIEGHCDERGTEQYNVALGERRARAAMSYLVAQGVPSTRIAIVSYGEERPVCTDRAEACWAKNRRAHFLAKRQ